jgi:hypothetical protein
VSEALQLIAILANNGNDGVIVFGVETVFASPLNLDRMDDDAFTASSLIGIIPVNLIAIV